MRPGWWRSVRCVLLGLVVAAGCDDPPASSGGDVRDTTRQSAPQPPTADHAEITRLVAQLEAHLQANNPQAVHALFTATVREGFPFEEFQTFWRVFTNNPCYGEWKVVGSPKEAPVFRIDEETGERLAELRLLGQTEKGSRRHPVEVRIQFAQRAGAWGIEQIAPVSTPPRVPITVQRQTPEAALESFLAAARENDAAALAQIITGAGGRNPAERAEAELSRGRSLGRIIAVLRDEPAEQMHLRYFLGKGDNPTTLPVSSPDPLLDDLQKQGATEARVHFLMVDDPERPRNPRGLGYIVLARFDDGWRIHEFIPPWSAK